MKNLLITVFFSLAINFIDIAPVQAAKKGFDELRSEHFVVKYEEGVNIDYVLKVKDIAEKYYRSITQEFNLIRDKLWLWDNRAKIFIAKDKGSYLENFDCSGWSAACVDYQHKIIYTYYGQANFSSIFAHELTHIIFREYIRKTKLPLWLDEGMATYIEDKYGSGKYRAELRPLRRSVTKGKYIRFPELVRVSARELAYKPADYVNLFYIQSFSIVNFIIEEYQQYNFSNFLHHLGNGYEVEEALAKAYYQLKNLEELEKRWKRFYRE